MRVRRERVDVDFGPLAVHAALDADVLLEPGDRGWPATVVAADPVDAFRYRRGDGRFGDAGGGSDGGGPDGGAVDGCFAALRDWLPPTRDAATHCGAYGFVGYDVWQEHEGVDGTAERDVALPDAAFGLYDTVALVEDDAVVVEAVDCEASATAPEDRIAAWRDRLADAAAPDFDRPSADAIDWTFDEAGYVEAVRTVQQRIRAGETFQANISRRASLDCPASALAVHARLRETNPAPYAALYDPEGDWAIASSSPELLVSVDGDAVTTRPIAGTRPRGAAAEGDDDAVAASLRGSPKERAEHGILVDLARNDVGAVCRHGSVAVEAFMEAVPYAAVTHLESVVAGRLRPDRDAVDALRSCFPGGTVTGAPKPRTMRIIDAVEPVERGPYTGSLGRLTFGGDAAFNILIRSAVIDGDRHHLQVGGGVVHDSAPREEFRETEHKARAVLAAYDALDAIAEGDGGEDGGGGDAGDGAAAERSVGEGAR